MSSPTILSEPSVIPSCSQEGDEPLYEIIDGLKVDLPPMSFFAAVIASRLQELLGPFVRANRLGIAVCHCLFILDAFKNRHRRPDVAFVSVERWPLDRKFSAVDDAWEIVPDLAIEVISPNEQFEDISDKLFDYFKFGVRQVWLFLPKQQQVHIYGSPTTVRILTDAQELEGSPLLPGFHLPLAPLFSRNIAGAFFTPR